MDIETMQKKVMSENGKKSAKARREKMGEEAYRKMLGKMGEMKKGKKRAKNKDRVFHS